MNRFLQGVARAVAETFDLPGPVLEIGSYQVAGQEALADLRGLFPGRPYTGLDMRPGPGVDLVADVEALPQADASVGTVLAMNTFEHVPRFWKGFAEVRRAGWVYLIATHLGTALVLLGFFLKDWVRIVRGILRSLRLREIRAGDTDARLGWLLVAGTVPVGVASAVVEATAG